MRNESRFGIPGRISGPLLIEEEIVGRAKEKAPRVRDHLAAYLFFAAVTIVSGVALYVPVHDWLHRNILFWFGLFVGSLSELFVVLILGSGSRATGEKKKTDHSGSAGETS